jgi:hypothetical protein
MNKLSNIELNKFTNAYKELSPKGKKILSNFASKLLKIIEIKDMDKRKIEINKTVIPIIKNLFEELLKTQIFKNLFKSKDINIVKDKNKVYEKYKTLIIDHLMNINLDSPKSNDYFEKKFKEKLTKQIKNTYKSILINIKTLNKNKIKNLKDKYYKEFIEHLFKIEPILNKPNIKRIIKNVFDETFSLD